MSNVIKSASRGDCDRCGANVQAHDDCTYLEEIRFAMREGKRPFCGFTKGRHIACSPSGAQALTGDDVSWLDARDLMVSAAMEFRPNEETYDDAIDRLLHRKVSHEHTLCITQPTNPPEKAPRGD
jgi:hypothetical protein